MTRRPIFEPSDTSKSNGFTVGHWTDQAAKTGCTVIVFNRSAPAIVDIRGGAPGTRETDLLGPGRLVQSVDAIVFSGGSAFGLSAADGVMAHLRELGRGVTTPAGPVPIVPAAVIFDLGSGSAIAPGPAGGAEAFLSRGPVDSMPRGLVGAGTGATTGKIDARIKADRGGFGYAHVDLGDGQAIHALVVVNAAGIVVDPETSASLVNPSRGADRTNLLDQLAPLHDRAATTLAVVVVAAPCDRRGLERCGVAAHDGLARAIRPCHTLFDGDVVFVAGLEAGAPSGPETVRIALGAELAVERAIVDAVTAT